MCVWDRHRSIEGHPKGPALEALPLDAFEDMAKLTYLHLARHPKLPSLPLFDGPTNLASVSLVDLRW